MWLWTTALAGWACDRALPPAAGLAAAADAIVVARGVGDRLEVERVLRGEVAVGKLNVRVEEVCGRAEPISPDPWLYYLRRDPDSWVVLADGQAPVGLGVPAAALEPIAKAQGASWSSVTDGWATILVEELPRPGSPAGVNLTAGIRNQGPAGRVISWNDWPPAQASHVTLDVTGPAGVVAPVPTGITPDVIRKYFEKNGRHFQISLEPGEFWLFPLPTVDSSPPGWGYKEELGFSYYPMPDVGDYTLVAHFQHLTDPPLPPSAPLVWRRR